MTKLYKERNTCTCLLKRSTENNNYWTLLIAFILLLYLILPLLMPFINEATSLLTFDCVSDWRTVDAPCKSDIKDNVNANV